MMAVMVKQDSSHVTISLNETLVAFLEDIFITQKLNNGTPHGISNVMDY
jgi:hypothetical protein